MPKNNQKGFTLIELLVVISILGILAAVVTMSVVGITNTAKQRAGATELKTVQVAMDTMLADQGVAGDAASSCAGAPTTAATAISDMTKFPSAAVYQVDAQGNMIPAHQTIQLYPHYLRENATHGTYYCTGLGEIVQALYNP
jgi:prepilin-type N-terminal cleavage/methylation domain-containing protein